MRAKTITSGAAMAALALVLAFLPLSFPFPPVPFLRFDPAEIPVFAALIGFGPYSAFTAALVYYFVLLAVGEFTPIGPSMKFLAVASAMLGFWMMSKMFAGKGVKAMLFTGVVAASVLRIFVMTAANYVVLAILFPEFLQFATTTLSMFLGAPLQPNQEGLLLVLTFTAIYNILHIPFTFIPAFLILKAVHRTKALGTTWAPWLIQTAKK